MRRRPVPRAPVRLGIECFVKTSFWDEPQGGCLDYPWHLRLPPQIDC